MRISGQIRRDGNGDKYVTDFANGRIPKLNIHTFYTKASLSTDHSIRDDIEILSNYWETCQIPHLAFGQRFFKYGELIDETIYSRLLHNDRGTKVLEFTRDSGVTIEDLEKIIGPFQRNRTIEYVIFDIPAHNCRMELMDKIFQMLLEHPTLKSVRLNTEKVHIGHAKYVSILLDNNDTLQSFTWSSDAHMSLEEFMVDYKTSIDMNKCPVYTSYETERSILHYLMKTMGTSGGDEPRIDVDLANRCFLEHVTKKGKNINCIHKHCVEESVYHNVIGTLRHVVRRNTSIKFIDIGDVLKDVQTCKSDETFVVDIQKECQVNRTPSTCHQKRIDVSNIQLKHALWGDEEGKGSPEYIQFIMMITRGLSKNKIKKRTHEIFSTTVSPSEEKKPRTGKD